jgi:hypothetical protein
MIAVLIVSLSSFLASSASVKRRHVDQLRRQQAGLKYLLAQLFHDLLRGDALAHHERILSIATDLHPSP